MKIGVLDDPQAVGIIFVTSMAQYAVEGYEVNAVDFMVKPEGYYNFSQKLEKAFQFIKTHKGKDIMVSSRDGIVRLEASEIEYIEKYKDFIVYHTANESIQERCSMKTIRENLDNLPFSECITGCLINLSSVKRIKKDIVVLVTGTELPLSRRLRKKFTEDYIRYMGGA